MSNIFENFGSRFIASLPENPAGLDLHFDEFALFDSDSLPGHLLKEDSDLLVVQGLPRDASPFLTFYAYSRSEIESRRQFFGVPESCLPIGHNGFGDVLAFDLDNREVVYFNHDKNNARVFVNSSLQSFAESLCLYQEHLGKGTMRDCLAAIALIDPRASHEGSMWQAEVSSELADEASLGLMDPLQQLRQLFNGVCEKVDHEWPFYTAPRHDGSPHIEISGDELSYVVTERGSELERRTTRFQDELLYWLASDMVLSLADHYELSYREPGRDFRRIMFARELELIGRINAAWRERKEAQIRDILEQHPYRDESNAMIG